MLAAKGHPVKASHMVMAGQLFGVSENHVRVALTRLTSEGFLKSVSRGVYTLGNKAEPAGEDVKDWASRLDAPAHWSGRFIAVHTNPLGRRDRQQVAQREKALAMYGFREIESGLFLRADNLSWGLDGLMTRMISKGLEPEAYCFYFSPRSEQQLKQIKQLWDSKKLERFYKSHHEKMKTWMLGYPGMALEKAAKEAYLLGSEGIYQVRLDPLLPDEWIDHELRTSYFNTVRQFAETGQQIWKTLQVRILKEETPLF